MVTPFPSFLLGGVVFVVVGDAVIAEVLLQSFVELQQVKNSVQL
jgi:hypothetical protein